MRPAVAVVVLVALLVVPLPAAPANAGADASVVLRPDLHASILIEGDAEFTAENGVRGGTGSASDPYVISDWIILHDSLAAVEIRNTSAHVIMRDLSVPAMEGSIFRDVHCVTDDLACHDTSAIKLANADNVTIRRVFIVSDALGIWVNSSADVRIEHVQLGVPQPAVVWEAFLFGVHVLDSQRVSVTHTNLSGALFGLVFTRVDHVRVSDTSVGPAVSVNNLKESTNVSIARSDFFGGTGLQIIGNMSDLSFVANHFRDGESGIIGNSERLDRATICGNEFKNLTDQGGLTSGPGKDVRISGNRFLNNSIGVNLNLYDDSTNVTFDHNLVAGSSSYGAIIGRRPFEAHNNSFINNGEGESFNSFTSVPPNATMNWWGDPSGPSGLGLGQGDMLVNSNATFSPWLTSSPELNVSCDDGGAS